ncbi:uncharacterized protein LOC123632297 [Lemur catta]|uniref:uncharacterized protein LOC123632296 n=1 Tax=Lemur catta TaxID=9447 RepID=UPI001E26A299|nr:uncharacterized protein LOC123632296 [Lemur catta]XP_045398359.1 uncharacterized protein LOC123632297 [Lemur catta]
MAFLVAGTLRVAAQMADARDSLGRKGKYSVQGPRVALTLSSPGVSAAAVAALEGVFRVLGFDHCERREASVQGFLEELVGFREWLDAHGGPVGCALVALVAPSGQLRQPQQLVRELSRCEALRGCPKVFLLLSSGPGATLEPGAFLAGLKELCSRFPHWSLVQLLTEVEAPDGESQGGGLALLSPGSSVLSCLSQLESFTFPLPFLLQTFIVCTCGVSLRASAPPPSQNHAPPPPDAPDCRPTPCLCPGGSLCLAGPPCCPASFTQSLPGCQQCLSLHLYFGPPLFTIMHSDHLSR